MSRQAATNSLMRLPAVQTLQFREGVVDFGHLLMRKSLEFVGQIVDPVRMIGHSKLPVFCCRLRLRTV